MKLYVTAALAATCVATPAFAQAPAALPIQPVPSAAIGASPVQPLPVQAVPAPIAPTTQPSAITVAPTALPAAPQLHSIAAGLNIPLILTSELSSSRNREGETFGMTVASDVMSDGVVVIPRGTRAVGEITLRSGRGMFGRSGKMELSFRYLDLDGIRIPLDGAHFHGGEGNTAGTIGAVLGAGVVGGLLVTGRSANFPEGREFSARTIDALPVQIVDRQIEGVSRPLARIQASYVPSPIQTGSAHRMEEERREQAARAARRARSRS